MDGLRLVLFNGVVACVCDAAARSLFEVLPDEEGGLSILGTWRFSGRFMDLGIAEAKSVDCA